MAKRQSYVVMGETFQTKSTLEERIRNILHCYRDGQSLSQADFSFMLEVLRWHPDYELKKGVGIKSIITKTNPFYRNTRCFWIIRQDGSDTDFSYLECLKGTPHEHKFINACRVAVEPYTQKFKREFFENLNGEQAICPLTGEPLFFIGSHVDHQAPRTFQQLVKEFVSHYNIDISQVEINTSAVDNTFQDTFADEKTEKLWVDYHNTHAELRIISRNANLRLPKL